MKAYSENHRVFLAAIAVLALVSGVFVKNSQVSAASFSQEAIHTESASIPGAIVEKVVIHPQKSPNSIEHISRKGILVRYPNAIATVLICHGFMCDKFDVGFLRDMFPREKYNVMTFDFRAHGEDAKGQRCTFGRDEAYDVIAAAQFLKNHSELKDRPLLVYGFSMGAVSAIEAQKEYKKKYEQQLFDGLVLDCPFDSSENLIKRGLDNLKLSLFGYQFNIPGKDLLQKYAFHPYVQTLLKIVLKTVSNLDSRNIPTNICPICPSESVKQVQSPCFFIHCKNDEKVTVAAVKDVFSGASGYKKLWITNGRHHFDSYFYNPEKYTKKVRKFLNHVVNGTIKSKKTKVIEDDDDGVAGYKSRTKTTMNMFGGLYHETS